MSIQAAVNQTLSIAGLLISMNPTLKAAAERNQQKAALSRRAGILEKGLEIAKASGDKDLNQELSQKLSETKKEQFMKDPTSESYSAYQQVEQQRRMSAEEAAAKADKAMADAQTEKRKGRRRFAEYLALEPTGYGVTVGQLPKNVQKELAKQYSKAERKELMDRRDAEKNVEK